MAPLDTIPRRTGGFVPTELLATLNEASTSRLNYHIMNSKEAMGSAPTGGDTVPLVSVIIPAFNHERYVEECLNSVLASDYPNVEIAIIDDGSSDRTLAVIEAWAERWGKAIPISVISRPNRGIARTLNELLAMARGVFVFPVASDDYLLPGGIRTLCDALVGRPHNQAVFADSLVVNEAGGVVSSSMLFGFHHASRESLVDHLAGELITNWGPSGSVLMYRREPIVEIGGYGDDRGSEDWGFYLAMLARGWLSFVDGTVGAYRVHGGNENRNEETWSQRRRDWRRISFREAGNFSGRERIELLLLHAVALPRPVARLGGGVLGRALRRTLQLATRAIPRKG